MLIASSHWVILGGQVKSHWEVTSDQRLLHCVQSVFWNILWNMAKPTIGHTKWTSQISIGNLSMYIDLWLKL